MCKIKTGIKMMVTPEQSRKVQEICFKNGIHWSLGKNLKYHLDKPFLFIDECISFMHEDEEMEFLEEDNEEVSAELFIRTNGTCVESEIPSKQPKTLSEYLKENNAYEEFIENYVEYYLEHIDYYTGVDLTDTVIDIYNISIGENSKCDINYWYNLYMEQPKNLVYDMNDVIFKEINKRIAEQETQPESDPKFTSENLTENSIVYDMDEIVSAKFITTEEFDQILQQKTSKRYMVFVEGKNTPRYIHNSYASAETEAKRLSTKLVGLKVSIVEVIKEFKSKVIVEEIK